MRKNFTRNKLAERINVKLGYSKEEAKEFIEVFLNYIKVNMKEKENIKISKLASFKVISKKERIGRNPKTKQEFIIPKRVKLQFKPSSSIKKLLN